MIGSIFNKDKCLFIPFVMAGYPSVEVTVEAILALAEAGADVIEVGVPFSDPVADGPINQKAAEVALGNEMCLAGVLDMIAEVRSLGCDVPIILFSYLNPIMAFGYESFVKRAREVGVDGVLVVDLPPEEGSEFYKLANGAGLEIVLLASPTTDPERFVLYRELKPCFVYYISRLAVTGVQVDLSVSLVDEIKELRGHLPGMNVAVGFGISTPEQAKVVAGIADGVIVGSKLVSTLGAEGLDAFKRLAEEFVEAVHGV